MIPASTLNLLETVMKRAACMSFVWLLGYLNVSLLWLAIFLFCVVSWERRRAVQRRQDALAAHRDEADMVFAHMSELPSWVNFPDHNRVEWINMIISRIWPFLNSAAEKIVVKEFEPRLRKDLPRPLQNAHFEKVNFGTKAPRIGGIKVYPQNEMEDPEVVIDLDFKYHSNADISLFLKYGITVGISDLRVSGKVRILIKPILTRVPLFGALSLWLIEQPNIDYQFTGIANVMDFPVLRSTIDRIVQERVSRKLVFPNRIFLPLLKNSSELEELADPMPNALVIVNLDAATNITGSDYRLFGPNTSDLYAIVRVGSHQFTSKVVVGAVDADWKEKYEFLIESHNQADVEIEVWDQDRVADDFIGRCVVLSPEVEDSLYSPKDLDVRSDEREKKGMLHLRLTYLRISRDPRHLKRLKGKGVQPSNKEEESGKPASDSTSADVRIPSDSLRRRHTAASTPVAKGGKEPKDTRRRHTTAADNLCVEVSQRQRESLLTSSQSSNPSAKVQFAVSGVDQTAISPVDKFHIVEIPDSSTTAEVAPKDDEDGENSGEQVPTANSGEQVPTAILFVQIYSVHYDRSCLFSPRTELLCRLSIGDDEKCTQAIAEQDSGHVSWNEKFHFTLMDVHQKLLSVELHESEGDKKAWVKVNIDDLLSVKGMSIRGNLPLTDKQLGVVKMSSDKSALSVHLKLSIRALVKDVGTGDAILGPDKTVLQTTDCNEVEEPWSLLQVPTTSLPQKRIRDGLLELSFRYSHLKHRLSVNIHSGKDLVPCHIDGTADPFIEGYLFPDNASHGRRRTSARRKTTNPKFEESFQFSVPFSAIHDLHLFLVVRNSPFRYGAFRTYLGEVLIDLNTINFSLPNHMWYRLQSRSETQRQMSKVDKFMEMLTNSLPVTSP